MSRFRELVAECERDELEQTQDIHDGWNPDGVWRVVRDDEMPNKGAFLSMQRAPELSMEQHR